MPLLKSTQMKSGIILFISLLFIAQTSFCVTKNWIGTGAGAGTSDWNTATNWNPSGIPGSADDVTIAITSANPTITFSGTPGTITINSLTFTVSGNNNTGKLDIGGNTLIITSNAIFNNPSGNSMTSLLVGVNGGTAAGVMDFGGTVTMSTVTNGTVGFMGNANSRLKFRNNLTFGPSGSVNSTNTPGTVEFTSLTSQTMTFNTSVGNFNNVIVGTGTNNPIVTFTGSSNAGVTGNLTLNGSSVLDLGTRTFNRSSAGGTLSLNSTSKLKLGASTGGVSGSNFPNNFSTLSLSATSTVEYNAAGGTDQTIYAVPVYGHLTLSRLSGTTNTNKTATASLTIKGNLTIGTGASFIAGTSLTHNLSGDWNLNGTFNYTTSSTINFTGTSSATINGTTSTAFNNIIVNKGSDITTILDATSAMSMNGNLTLTNGLFRISHTSASLQFGTTSTIASTSGIELNGGTINANNLTITNNGLFKMTNGTATIGNASGIGLSSSSTGTFTQSGGTVNISGRMTFTGGNMNMSGGTLNICTVGNSSTSSSLNIDGACQLQVSAGTILFMNANSGTGNDLNVLSGSGTKIISGGNIKMGNASSTAFKINCIIPVYNFEMNSTGNATLLSMFTINNLLTFTNGKITTGSNKVIIPLGGSITGASSGKYVNGFLEKSIPASATNVTFEIGCPTNYGPVKLSFNGTTNGSGSITAKCISTDHPDIANSGIDNAKSVNRYWMLTNSNVSGFTSFDAIFNFNNPADVDAGLNTSAVVIRMRLGSVWFSTNAGALTTNSSQALAVSDFGDFQIGEPTGLPLITCSTVNATTATGCSGVVNFAMTSTSIPSPVITYSQNPGTIFNVGSTNVIATATNINGSSSCSFDVKLKETQAPQFQNCPANFTVAPSGNCEGYATWTPPTATDNCSQVTLSSNYSSGSIFPGGSTAVIYTATDSTGNASTCSFNVSVIDNIAPVISSCPADITVTLSGTCTKSVSWIPPTATDNCTFTLTSNVAPGAIFPKGTNVVTYTATDGSGNVATCSFNVIVIDNQAPVINCPSDITTNAPSGACGATVTFSVTATDNCTAALVTTPASGSFFPVGNTTVTSTATDPSGNVSSCTFHVIVIDNQLPVISCPADINVNTPLGTCGKTVTFTVTATDNCSATVVNTPPSGSFFPIGNTTITSVATDASGNSITCTFRVKMKDTQSPVISNCPPNISVNLAAGTCTNAVSWTPPTASDNCSVILTSNHNPGELFPRGITTVTYTATDPSGNIATCNFNVTVRDLENPVISCPGNINANVDAGFCSAVVNFTVNSTDNCSATVTSTPASGSVFPIGTTTVNSVATDAAGNSSACSFTITVSDNQSPVISCPSNISEYGCKYL